MYCGTTRGTGQHHGTGCALEVGQGVNSQHYRSRVAGIAGIAGSRVGVTRRRVSGTGSRMQLSSQAQLTPDWAKINMEMTRYLVKMINNNTNIVLKV